MDIDYIINLIRYVALGAIRGFGDILPVEGSAHIAFLNEIFFRLGWIEHFNGLDQNLFASSAVRLGSFLGLIVLFKRETLQLGSMLRLLCRRDWLGSMRTFNNILGDDLSVQTVPWLFISLLITAITALGLRSLLLRLDVLDRVVYFSFGLCCNGILIGLSALNVKGTRRINQLGPKDFVLIGLSQALGVIPGLSRLALTLCAALLRKMSWLEAIKLSFILSLPTLLLSGLGGWIGYFIESHSAVSFLSLICGTFFAFVASRLATRMILTTSLNSQAHFLFFGIYCFSVGIFAYFTLFLKISKY